MLGDRVATFAVPTMAILTLHATTFEVGLLTMATYVAYPVAGLGAGLLVDRFNRRRMMVLAGAARLVLFLSIPVAHRFGVLTIDQLLLVVAVSGCFTMLYDVALQGYLPLLLPGADLPRGNARVEVSRTTSQVVGPALGGALSSAFGASCAVALNATSFLGSILSVLSVRTCEPPPEPRSPQDTVAGRLREGFVFVLTHDLLRPLTLSAAVRNLGITVTKTAIFLYAYRALRLSVDTMGVILAGGAVTAVLGASVAGWAVRRFGYGRTLLFTVAEGVMWLLVPLALLGHPALALGVVVAFAAPWLPIWNSQVATARQVLAPAPLQSRVLASIRTIAWGTLPLGSLLGGVLASVLVGAFGERAGLALTIVLGGLIATSAGSWLLAPAVRNSRQVPRAPLPADRPFAAPVPLPRAPVDSRITVTEEWRALLLDTFKVVHWMNARKFTSHELAVRLDLGDEEFGRLLAGDEFDVADEVAELLAMRLDIELWQISAGAGRNLVVIRGTAEMRATRRAVRRDGIHFYNYYTMAAPAGRVAPVILDILCPADRLPALNNGHLEPAITVNLGPGDINGRWGTELTESTWHRMRAGTAAVPWVAGDSYVEPSFCPHSYSLATDVPARIISYTGASGLQALVGETNSWADHAFEAMVESVSDGSPAAILRGALARRGHDLASLARETGIAQERLADVADLTLDEVRTVAGVLATDYRVLLPATRDHDDVGKTYCPVQRSVASIRPFRSYEVASLAAAPHLPDLTGLYVHVDNATPEPVLDLCDLAETHYLVLDGEVTLWWRQDGAGTGSALLTGDGSAWVPPFVAHGWSGSGSVVKLGSGSHLSYVNHLELSNTFQPQWVLRRGRRDRLGWGYDAHKQDAHKQDAHKQDALTYDAHMYDAHTYDARKEARG
jgi:2-hydroxyethylphosphonate dioxygenase